MYNYFPGRYHSTDRTYSWMVVQPILHKRCKHQNKLTVKRTTHTELSQTTYTQQQAYHWLDNSRIWCIFNMVDWFLFWIEYCDMFYCFYFFSRIKSEREYISCSFYATCITLKRRKKKSAKCLFCLWTYIFNIHKAYS